jgi:hypothetical protein
MAKKNKINPKVLYGGIGVIAIAGILIAVFGFGIGFDFVKPLFQEQKPLTVQQQQENAQVIFEIDKLLCPQGSGTQSDPCILTEDPADKVKELQDKLIPEPTPTNQTEFSSDSPGTQICDELELGCGSRTFELTSTVTKTDSLGVKEVIEKKFTVGQLSLFLDNQRRSKYY